MANEDQDGDSMAPARSRIGRGPTTGYRALRRPTHRDRFSRVRHQLPLEQLIGRLIDHHGVTDELRQRVVCLYWFEIAGDRFAAKTFPIAITDGVLQVAAASSAWVHEMRFFEDELIATINRWVYDNRVWLGPPPLVTSIRFVLNGRQRTPLVDRDDAQRRRIIRLMRSRPRIERTPPGCDDRARDAIRSEVGCVEDLELRAMIEAVRTKWNR